MKIEKTKICNKCGKEKSVEEFNKHKRYKDGLYSWCKECKNGYNKQRYENNKRDIINRIKQYREENKEKISEQRKQYYEENKEKIKQYCEENKEKRKEYHKQWREENKEKMKEYHKQWCEENKEKIKKYKKQWSKEKAKYDSFVEQISFCEEVRRDPKDDILLQVRCTESGCRKWFNPTNLRVQNRIASLNSKGTGENRFYCSEECKQICSLYNQIKYPKGFKPYYDRADQEEWARMVKERDNYECQKCGSIENLVAHHVEGIHENPFMSCDIDLGITLCKECHKEAHRDIGCRYSDLTRESLCRKEE